MTHNKFTTTKSVDNSENSYSVVTCHNMFSLILTILYQNKKIDEWCRCFSCAYIFIGLMYLVKIKSTNLGHIVWMRLVFQSRHILCIHKSSMFKKYQFLLKLFLFSTSLKSSICNQFVAHMEPFDHRLYCTWTIYLHVIIRDIHQKRPANLIE